MSLKKRRIKKKKLLYHKIFSGTPIPRSWSHIELHLSVSKALSKFTKVKYISLAKSSLSRSAAQSSRCSIDQVRLHAYMVTMLRDPDTSKTFRLEPQNSFSAFETDSTNSVNVEQNRIKMVYLETSFVRLGHKTPTREDWMSQKTWNLINERRKLHHRLLAITDERSRRKTAIQADTQDHPSQSQFNRICIG